MHETSGLLDPSPTTTRVAVSEEGSEVLTLLGTWKHGWPVLGLQEIDRIRVGCSGLARARSCESSGLSYEVASVSTDTGNQWLTM